jgi:type I restriction enzyme, R subunit
VIAPVDILSSEFDARLERLPSVEAQALEMTHAAQHEIKLKFAENPVLYASLRERLEEIIRSRREGRLGAAAQVGALLEVVERLRNAPQNRAQQLGLSADAEAFYGLLEKTGKPEVEVARSLERSLRDLMVVEWTAKPDVLREMRRLIKRELRGSGLDRDVLEMLTTQVLEVARVRMAR